MTWFGIRILSMGLAHPNAGLRHGQIDANSKQKWWNIWQKWLNISKIYALFPMASEYLGVGASTRAINLLITVGGRMAVFSLFLVKFSKFETPYGSTEAWPKKIFTSINQWVIFAFFFILSFINVITTSRRLLQKNDYVIWWI